MGIPSPKRKNKRHLWMHRYLGLVYPRTSNIIYCISCPWSVLSVSSHGYVDLSGYRDGYEGFCDKLGDLTAFRWTTQWVWAVFVQKWGLIDAVTDKSLGHHVLFSAHSHAPIVMFTQKRGYRLITCRTNHQGNSPAKLHMYIVLWGGGGREHKPLFGYFSC